MYPKDEWRNFAQIMNSKQTAWRALSSLEKYTVRFQECTVLTWRYHEISLASLWRIHRVTEDEASLHGQSVMRRYFLCCPPFTHLPPGQNGRHFADDIFRCIFMNEKLHILIEISLKFTHKGPIDNNPALVYIMAWRRIGDKPLSEPMLKDSLTHICDTKGRWVKTHLSI